MEPGLPAMAASACLSNENLVWILHELASVVAAAAAAESTAVDTRTRARRLAATASTFRTALGART